MPSLPSSDLGDGWHHLPLHAPANDHMVRGMVERGRLKGHDRIGVRVGKVINKHWVAKHVVLDIGDDHFRYAFDEQRIAAEAALDGLYMIRTSLDAQRINSEDAVRSYKQLAQVSNAPFAP